MKIQVDHGFTSDQVHIKISHGDENIDLGMLGYYEAEAVKITLQEVIRCLEDHLGKIRESIQEQDPVFVSVSKIISDYLSIDIETVSIHSRLYEDLGMDSLDGYEIIYKIDMDLGVSIHQDHIYSHELKTVGGIVEYIKAKQADSNTQVPPAEPVPPKNREIP